MAAGHTAGDELPPGTRVGGRYVVKERIGSGGMAQVYRGEHTTIARQVAIKVLAAAYSKHPATVVRFLQEARAASQVAHENVVEVTDFGETETGQPFIVMEYLAGESLAATMVAEGPFEWSRAQPILLQILAALCAAHDHRVIHRDMKPGNCFRIERMGTVDFIKVLDFGIAKVLREDGTGITLTQQGTVMGTPDYMAPEQCRGTKVDARSDLYAVGVMAYEMLTGKLPFRADEAVDVMHMHVFEPPPPMREVAPHVEVPARVEALVRKVLAKDPDQRPASAGDLARALLSEGEPEPSGNRLMTGLRRLFGR
jgi:serine/threonine protein kinase